MAGDATNQVWLTSVLTDEDVPKALTLCFSLKAVMTSRSVGVIASQKVSPSLREGLHHAFDLFYYLDEDRNTTGLKTEEFVKLFVLSIKSIAVCVYLAPTILVIKSADEIFDEHSELNDNIAWMKNTNDLLVFMVRPSLRMFEDLSTGLRTRNGTDFETYLRTWKTNQREIGNKFLDSKYYHLLTHQNLEFDGNESCLSIVNIVDIPFSVDTKKFGLIAQLVLDQRKKIFTDLVRPLLDSKSSFVPSMDEMFLKNSFSKEPVAIVGMSCRYPSANNLDEFWKLLSNGEDGTGNPPEYRWRHGKLTKTILNDFKNTNAGFLKYPVEDFDAKFFGISPKEVLCLDPQHRLLHELVWKGLEDAGINPNDLRGTAGGVFMGSWTNEYKEVLNQAGNSEFYRIYMGNSIGAAAARISHLLDLTGPSLATESGCSSAMVAVHLACKSLQRGESSFALACGVNLLLTPFDKDIMPMVLSADGHCKTFDANADGFARAEGCGVLVLKRLSDAVRDKDNIWALIKGSAMTQEGISKSMGTPTVHCESMAMRLALQDAGMKPENVSYVETHGTGTPVGDPMEIAAIAKAYRSTSRTEPLLIGSVKTNVGHTESCSGITGIIKVVLAMHNETIPPHRNFENLNPAIDLDAVPAIIPMKSVPWLKEKGNSRVAGVSSFGITGTDAHAIIEESPQLYLNPMVTTTPERSLNIMKISAKTEEALNILLENYKHYLSSTRHNFSDIAYTANVGRGDFSHRAVVIANSNEKAIQYIENNKFLRGEEPSESVGKVCFLFTGQGSQYPGMAKKLYDTSPVFRMHFDYCEKILSNKYNINITDVLWSDKSDELKRTIYSQTSIFCVEYALLKLWGSWGVKPDLVLGHSLGEFAATVCAGILTVEDAITLVAERSRLIDELPSGKMLVIKADKQRVESLMIKFGNILDYAAINTSEQTVLAGDPEKILEFAKCCEKANLKCIILGATHAFHSKHMDPILKEYKCVANSVKKLEGNTLCKYISGVKGTCMDVENIDAEYWVQHTREQVSFQSASKAAVELGARIFIEIGPQPILSAMTMVNNEAPLVCLASLKKNENEWDTLFNSLGKLYMKGIVINWKGLDLFCKRIKCRLPTYPFIGKAFWPESIAASGEIIHPLIGHVISNASSIKLFQSALSVGSMEWVKDHAIGENIIFPGSGYLEMCLAAGLATIECAINFLPPPSRAMKIENLVIEAPLSLEEAKIIEVQTVVELNTSGDMKVRIHKKLESDSTKWLSHAQATFSPVPSLEERDVQFDGSDFKKLVESPSNEDATVDEVYNKLASLGLKFGPTFRSIERVWRRDQNTLLAKVKIPSMEDKTQYIIHPVVLDAMIQAIMMLRVDLNMKKKLYVPIKIGKFVWLSDVDSSKDVYIHCFVNTAEEGGSATTNATAVLLDNTGTPLATMSSVELIDTTVKAIESVLEQQKSSMPDMYEEVWRPKIGARTFYTNIEKASGKFYTDEFKQANEELIQNQPDYINEMFVELEKFVYWNMLKGMYECGWKPAKLNETFKELDLFEKLKISSQHKQYFGFMLEVFEQEGILKNVTRENECSGFTWKIIKSPPHLEEVMLTLNSSSTANLTAKFHSTLLFKKLGETLSAVLKGEVSGLSILFPPEKTDYPSAGDFYIEYGDCFKVEKVVADALSKWMEHAKEKIGDDQCILRILEVGAGTGSLTGTLLRNLETNNIRFEYTYSDLSVAFFPAAEKRFEKHAKHMKYKKLNIEEDPLDQGFTPEYFDFAFASDVLHATKNIRQALQNMRVLMKPHAKLDIQEMTRVLRLATYSFGLLEGFWRFEDKELRPKHCTLSKQTWARVLEECGFKVNGVFSTIDDYHSYICCERTEAPLCQYLVPSVSPKKSKSWLVFHLDTNPVSNYILEKIRATTTREAILVIESDKFVDADTIYKLRPDSEDDFRNLLQALHNRNFLIEGIVYCWSLNKNQTSPAEILQPYFYLAKAIQNSKERIIPRLYPITSGVVPLENNDMSHFYSSTIWGFSKSLKNENLLMNGRCIEVADGIWDEERLQEIFYEIWNLDKDNMVAFHGKARFIPKLQQHKPKTNDLSLPKGTDRFQLILPDTKTVSDLQFGPLDEFKLKEDEVEVQIKASALNFRDILSIIKPSDDFKDVNTVGFDFAGVIKRVGKEVTKWKIGDRVCGVNVHLTAMPNHVALNEKLLLPLNDNMSFCEGSTMPAVYITSTLCLLQLAKIKKDDIVLIHTASGGVGLSAIEICKNVGCTIIATAGSKRKQNYLRSLGIENIFHSRTTQYGNQILEFTNGRGVDVVLNSLTGEGFKEATLNACAEGARFIEMSKLNIWTDEEVKELRPDVNYMTVDLSQCTQAEWTQLLQELSLLLDKNIAKPIPYVRFDALNVRDAIQYMQKASHVGKVVCVLPDLRNDEGQMKINTLMFSDGSSYLITGGLGGIGLVVCQWMLQKGAKHIILVGRSPPTFTVQTKINELISNGANVNVFQLDVGNFEQCQNLIENKIKQLRLPPLKGIMHAAGTLADCLIANHEWTNLTSVFNTKINGTLHLHELTKNHNLEHFVLFSSMASLFGTPGQSNHSAANNFEDTFAHYRHSIGLPATAINWGQWGEVGIATEVDLPGIGTLSNIQGITGLEYVMKFQRTQTAVFNVNSFVMLGKFYPFLSTYIDEGIWKKTVTNSGASITIKPDEFWQQYDSASVIEDKANVLKVQVTSILRNILKLEDNELIGEDVDLQEMGVDSLMFVEIKNSLTTLLCDRVTITVNSLKDCNTINLISKTIVGLIEGTNDQVDQSFRKPTMDEVNELMIEDCQLPDHIYAKSEQQVVKIAEIQTVLLTGCTGTLGPYILKKLANLPQIKKIVCLMRPSKLLSPQERLSKILKKLELYQEIPMEKIICVTGNVAKPHLGLDSSIYKELSEKVHAVFHCACLVEHARHYVKMNSQKDMRAVNIGGMKNILEFACETKLKYVYHASTMLAVTIIDNERVSERWPEMGEFDGITTYAYPITKFVGEILIKQAVERGIPCQVFRFPLIVGESDTGRCSIENNHSLLRYMFIMKHGVMPSMPFLISMLPVDVCADVSLRLFFENEEPDIYNISHGLPSTDQEFIEVAKKFGYAVNFVDMAEFSNLVQQSRGDTTETLQLFKDLYSDEEAVVASISNTAVLQKWIEERDSAKEMWRSEKVLRSIPDFYSRQKQTMEYTYADLNFCKAQGWFEKFGL